MKYKYPKISNTLTYKRIDSDSVKVIDHLTEDEYIFSIEATRYIKRLNGKIHPYKIQTRLTRNDIHDVLEFLQHNDLTRNSDTRVLSLGTVYKTLWTPRWTLRLKILAYILNFLLSILWFPVLALGILMFSKYINHLGDDWIWLGYIIGLISGMLFHELGHAFAGISYGAPVFEMGVMIQNFIMPGAYVLLDDSCVKKRFHRIQIDAAGVESNLLLAGLFLFLGTLFLDLGFMFMMAAICNVLLAAFNLTFLKGLDGSSIISELLGTKELVEQSISVVLNKRIRKYLIHQGTSGYAVITLSFIIYLLQFALPTLLIMNILEIVSCFV